MSAMHNPFFDMKFAVTLSLAIPAIASSACICRGPKPCCAAGAGCCCCPSGCSRSAIGSETMMPPAMPMTMRLVGKNSRVCMFAIPRCRCRCLRGRCSACATARRRTRARRRARRPVVGGPCRDAVRLALHRRFAAVRRDLVHDRDRAGDGDRRAGGVEGPAVLASPASRRRRRALLHAVEAQHLLRGRRPQRFVGVLAASHVGLRAARELVAHGDDRA